MKALVCLCH